VEDVRRFETELLDHIRASEEQILTGSGKAEAFRRDFRRSRQGHRQLQEGLRRNGRRIRGPEEHAEALDEDELGKESVKVNKPAPEEKKK